MSVVDIASLAGVSKATVSRVLNGTAFVDPEKAKLVQDAVHKLGYRPPDVRRGPKLGSKRIATTGQVGLLAGEFHTAVMSQMPVFPRLINGLQAALAVQGLNLVLLNRGENGDLPGGISAKRLDGLFVIGRLDEQAMQKLTAIDDLPVIWLMRAHSDLRGRFDHVFYNNESVGRLAGQYVLDKGHRNVAFINASPGHTAFPSRGIVFADVVKAAGGSVHMLISEGDSDLPPAPGAHEALVRQFTALSPRPTAVFVPNDGQVAGVYLALSAAGITPGKDVEIVSCDNERSIIEQLSPRPATIDLNLDAVGRHGVEQLQRRLQQRNRKDPRITLLVEPTLIAQEKKD